MSQRDEVHVTNWDKVWMGWNIVEWAQHTEQEMEKGNRPGIGKGE